MNEFLKFFDEKRLYFHMHLEIYYSKIMDWCIRIWKEGAAKDYPGSRTSGDAAVLVEVQSSDMELCFAMAHVELKEWLAEHTGGY